MSQRTSAQSGADERRNISGMILERGTNNTRIADANVTNLNSQQKTRTSMQGIFTIPVAIGDSISIEKIGYGTIKTQINTVEDIILEMQSGLQIETVVVSRGTRESEMRGMLRDYERKGVYRGGHNSVGTYLASPATALYNLFGKEPKNARRFEEYMNQELEETKIDRIFSKSIVTELTGLEGEDLQSFMDWYRPSLSTAERWGRYDLMVYINKSFESWEAEGRPKSQKLPKLEIPKQEK
ncbi:carboxypeptidase-like regulatory domain-containing protein [Sphingobacterium sp. lm-10]|uniref:carboxypeptidase-like regulatory domain-containing protein n=1 Tax=Sphingobacterium sp. lm-10 TaxID=2944904 RepID=UPI002021D498|nr:carboxypeptidase-like regulatory domain-containing protein [Sphingobacterium sp. lm-10]MCL7989476.1 carboxypeptidase-like regulatory domain-containing protein [Sphingobacterium sp. lm-10]